MTPAKTTDQGTSRSSPATTTAHSPQSGRKPWKKKNPVEIILGQIEKVREDVKQKEEELKIAKRQLQKLEEATKLLEST